MSAPTVAELADVLRVLVKASAHEYACPLASWQRHGREAQVGSVRRGRGASTEAAAIERARREFAEYEAARPACTCAHGRALALLAKLDAAKVQS